MATLVTGGTGFLGSAVVRELLKRGETVRALARPNSDRRNLEGLQVELVEGDLTNHASLDQAVSGCEALYHVAADYRLWVPEPETIYRNNVDGTRHLMQAARNAGVARIVYTSSVATLGLNADATPADEDTPVTLNDMIGHYKRSKYLAEKEVRRMVKEENLPAVIVNPSTPIGPRDIKPTPTGRMILDAVRGKMPAYVDTGLNIAHVDDVAYGHLLAFDKGVTGERYILGGENMTLKEILTQIAEIAGTSPPRIKLPTGLILPIAHLMESWARLTKSGEPLATVDGVKLARKKMFFSAEKARKLLGYEPRSAREALEDAVAWFLNFKG